MLTDSQVVEQLRCAAYMHFPQRDILVFEELLRRYEAMRQAVQSQNLRKG